MVNFVIIERERFTCLVEVLCSLGFNFSAIFASAGRKLAENLDTAVSQEVLGPLHIQILVPKTGVCNYKYKHYISWTKSSLYPSDSAVTYDAAGGGVINNKLYYDVLSHTILYSGKISELTFKRSK